MSIESDIALVREAMKHGLVSQDVCWSLADLLVLLETLLAEREQLKQLVQSMQQVFQSKPRETREDRTDGTHAKDPEAQAGGV